MISAGSNIRLHREVVRGIAQVVLYLRSCQKENKQPSWSESVNIGLSKKRPRAGMFILEFVKDVPVTQEMMKKTEEKDYSWIWAMVNDYLKGFGHEPIDPVSVRV